VESNTRYTLFCNLIAAGRGLFWITPAILWGRHVLKSHPNAEFICDYLENDAYLVGHLIVPEKYNAAAREKYRAARYEWYLKRGLPIPREFMPRDELELLEKRRLYNEMTKRGETTASVKAFEPRISMGMDSGDQIGTTGGKVEEDKGKIRKSIFRSRSSTQEGNATSKEVKPPQSKDADKEQSAEDKTPKTSWKSWFW